MTIAEQLTELNDNLSTINNEIITQEDMIAQIKTKLEGGVIEITPTPKAFYGTVTTNQDAEVHLPYPGFVPKQIIIWNIGVQDQWEETGDDSLIRYLYGGTMLCAVRIENGDWIAHYMKQGSGAVYIAQNSAEVAPYPPAREDYPYTNIIDTGDTIIWCLGDPLYSYEDFLVDFTEVTFNYVLVG